MVDAAFAEQGDAFGALRLRGWDTGEHEDFRERLAFGRG